MPELLYYPSFRTTAASGSTTRAINMVVALLACTQILALQPGSTRRSVIIKSASSASALFSLGPANAYDSIPTGVPSAKAPPPRQLDWNEVQSGKYGKPPPQEFKDPEVLRKERMKAKAEREKKAAAKNAEADVLIAQVTKGGEAKDPVAFSDATDKLSLWIIEQGPPLPPPGGPWADILQSSPLPEGFETRQLIRECKEALTLLPRVGRSCEKTRDNNGVCYDAGPLAESSYSAMLKELKKRAPLQYDTPYGPVSF